MHYKIILFFILFINSLTALQVFTQNNINITGGNFVLSNNYLVLNDTKFTNNGTFDSGTGTVTISGNAIDANSAIEGASPTTFYNLIINKSNNGAQLGNNTSISNQLTLSNGNLDIQTFNLIIQNTAMISGGSVESYIQTTNSGRLIQEVGNSNVVFPIGNQSYTPVILNNIGTADNFNIRVENVVYLNGTSGNTITTDVVGATWHIDETIAGGSDVGITFQWNGSEEMTNFDRTQSFVSHYTSGNWNNFPTQTAGGSNPYSLSQNAITSFSPFTIASNTAVLPVELLYFYGEKVEKGVQLDWETASEINNSHFEVEWRRKGIDFEKIGEVNSAGTNNAIQFYEFLHLSPVVGNNYYRLKQVDLDGQFEYTEVVNIEFQREKTAYQIYPNPASHYFQIESAELMNEMIQLFNVHGQLVMETNHESPITNISITNLPNGTYFVKIGQEIKKITILK